jgi:hypothetical protein
VIFLSSSNKSSVSLFLDNDDYVAAAVATDDDGDGVNISAIDLFECLAI